MQFGLSALKQAFFFIKETKYPPKKVNGSWKQWNRDPVCNGFGEPLYNGIREPL